MHDVGTRKQLFIDERFIASKQNVTLTVNPPVKAGPIDVKAFTAPSIVEHGGTFHLYQGLNGTTQAWTSTDGLTWRHRGVLPGVAAPGVATSINSVFIDPKDSAFPFKGLYELLRQDAPLPGQTGARTQAVQAGGLMLCRSRDGLNWDYLPGMAVPFLCDTQNQMLYDPRIDRYVAYVRAFPTLEGARHRHRRCVARVETSDLGDMPWPHGHNPANTKPDRHDYPYINDEYPIVLAADPEDPPNVDLYNPCVHVYSHAQDVYLAFPSMYRCWGYTGANISAGRDHRGSASNDGLFETQMAVSRDGVNFTRFRSPYTWSGLVSDRHGTGAVDCGLSWMGIGMIRHGDEVWQYLHAARRTHEPREVADAAGRTGEAILRLVQRLDGFVSVDAGHRGGELTTPPLTFSGSRLTLNAGCHGLGEVWVELQDAGGKPLPGYALADAVSIDRNGTAQEVWWKSGPDVAALADKPVRLRFVLRSAKLYAFQFS